MFRPEYVTILFWPAVHILISLSLETKPTGLFNCQPHPFPFSRLPLALLSLLIKPSLPDCYLYFSLSGNLLIYLVSPTPTFIATYMFSFYLPGKLPIILPALTPTSTATYMFCLYLPGNLLTFYLLSHLLPLPPICSFYTWKSTHLPVLSLQLLPICSLSFYLEVYSSFYLLSHIFPFLPTCSLSLSTWQFTHLPPLPYPLL